MFKRLARFMFGWVTDLIGFIKDLLDPDLNSDFFDKIDHDYHP